MQLLAHSRCFKYLLASVIISCLIFRVDDWKNFAHLFTQQICVNLLPCSRHSPRYRGQGREQNREMPALGEFRFFLFPQLQTGASAGSPPLLPVCIFPAGHPPPEFPSPDPPLTELRVPVAPPWGAVSSRCWNLAHLSPRLKAAPPRHSPRGSPYAAAPHRCLHRDVTASPPANCVLPRRAQF